MTKAFLRIFAYGSGAAVIGLVLGWTFFEDAGLGISVGVAIGSGIGAIYGALTNE